MTIPVGFAQITFLFGGTGLPNGAACTLGVQNPNDDTAQEIADAAAVLWVAEMQPALSSHCTFLGTLAKKGPDATGQSATSPASVAGGDAATAIPANTAILVKKQTALGGRKGRGRMFVPGLDDTDVDSAGIIAGGKVTVLQNNMNDIATGLATATYIPYLLHSDLTTPTLITALSVDTKVATQRRRLRR